MRGALGVRRALRGPGVPRVGAERGSWHWLGPGNTNVGGRLGSTRYTTLPGTQYTTLQVPTQRPARAVASGARVGSTPGTCTYDRFGRTQGDPRGVKRTVGTAAR